MSSSTGYMSGTFFDRIGIVSLAERISLRLYGRIANINSWRQLCQGECKYDKYHTMSPHAYHREMHNTDETRIP